MSHILQVVDLTKSYESGSRRVRVLDGVEFAVKEGELVGIVGASGVGKTTLLHLVGGLDRPTRGEVFFDGHDIFSWDDSRLSRFRNRELGFVFQLHHLLPEFTAIENVMMPALVAGKKRGEAQEMASAILERMGLAGRLENPVGSLSGGEQQRVAIARAMVLGPRLLLADEPTGSLDRKTGETVADLIFSLRERFATTILVVTHDLGLASRMERCLGIEEGKVVELDPEGLVPGVHVRA